MNQPDQFYIIFPTPHSRPLIYLDELMTHDFVMAFVRVAHSAGQSHVPLFVNLLNEIVAEEPLAPQKRRWFFNFVMAFVRLAHSLRQSHGIRSPCSLT